MTTVRPSVLVVDDEDEVRALVRQALEDGGFEVLEAASGAEALAAAARGPDVVVLDVRLPDVSGLEVCARLKARPATRSVPVVLVSAALTRTDDRARGLETGADACLAKPFAVRELVAMVGALLKLRRAEEEAEVAAAVRMVADAIGGLPDLDAIVAEVGRIAPPLIGVSRCAVTAFDPRAADVAGAGERGEASRARPDLLVVPLVSGARVLGRMTVEAPEPRPFTGQQVAIAHGIAAHVTLAVDRALAHRELQRRRAESEALSEIGRMLSASLDLPDVSQAIVENVRVLLGAASATLFEIDPESGDVDAVADTGLQRWALGGFTFPHGTGLVGRAIAARQPVIATNVLEDPTIVVPPAIRAAVEPTSLRAILAVPLVVGNDVVGVLSVADREQRVFTADDVALVRAFAAHAAISLQNARRFEEQRALLLETRRRREEALALEAVVHQITSSLDVGEVMTRIVEAARTMCEADLAFIAPYDAETDTATIVAVAGALVPGLAGTIIRPGRGMGDASSRPANRS